MTNATVIEEKSRDLVICGYELTLLDYFEPNTKYASVRLYDIIAYNISNLHICKR